MIELSVVIPVYNESENILKLHNAVREALQDLGQACEVIWVNDGSTDTTSDLLLDITKNSNKNLIKIIELNRNYGQTTAMLAGIENSQGNLISFLDGDNQNDPKDIPKLIAHLYSNNLDAVCGWRNKREDKFIKRFISKGAYYLRQILFNDNIHDSGCTLKVIKKEAINSITIYGEMHRLIPTLLILNGWKVGELKVNHNKRFAGRTKYNYKRILKSYIDMLSVSFWGKFPGRPLHFLGYLGFTFILFGLFFTILWIYLNLTKSSLFKYSLPSISTFFVLSGINLFFTGIVLDVLNKIMLRGGVEPKYIVRRRF